MTVWMPLILLPQSVLSTAGDSEQVKELCEASNVDALIFLNKTIS